MTKTIETNSLSRILTWKWIYVILIGSFFFILVNPIPFPVEINRWTQAYYDYVESIPSGSLVIMSPDFVAAGYQENGYAGEGMLKQFWRNGLDVILVGFQPESTQMSEKMVSRISDYIAANNVVYGEDYWKVIVCSMLTIMVHPSLNYQLYNGSITTKTSRFVLVWGVELLQVSLSITGTFHLEPKLVVLQLL
jgi:hypothetical protein